MPITKTGNGHLRRVLEAAWRISTCLNVIGVLLRRQKSLAISDEAKDIAWKAQQRLHKRYKAMAAGGKNKNQIVTAIGREMLGFIGVIAVETEKQHRAQKPPERSLFDQLDSSADDGARGHEKENPHHVLWGTVSDDLVKSDEEGFLYCVGRRDALIKSY